jgi:HD-like signal output (HDOD) protein
MTTPMSSLSTPPVDGRVALDDQEIRRRINACPKLASLQANNDALSALVKSDQSLTSQIAEIIRRDPSLSARLLRMVNSVYFGLGARVNNIEEAVFFLGLRQIRELSVATPVIEELERLQGNVSTPLPWKDLWAHSIGCAILTREILRATPLSIDDDTDYLVGLLHNVGKVVMAYAFPRLPRRVGADFQHAAPHPGGRLSARTAVDWLGPRPDRCPLPPETPSLRRDYDGGAVSL